MRSPAWERRRRKMRLRMHARRIVRHVERAWSQGRPATFKIQMPLGGYQVFTITRPVLLPHADGEG